MQHFSRCRFVPATLVSDTMPSSTEQLIESVKKYPILYDLGNSEYKNIRKRDKIWDEIGVELDESGKYN